MSDTITLEPIDNLLSTINRAAFQKERVRITRGGKDIAAVIPIEDLELLEELEDPTYLLEALEATEEAIENSSVIPWEQLEAQEYCKGFASRSVSIMRYRVRGEIEGSFWEAVEAGIKRGSFQESQTSGDVVGMGWTSTDDFTDSQFTGASYRRGNSVALSLRIDTVRVPPRILEIELKKESRKKQEESGQFRLSSDQRRELKEHLKESLRRQVFPSIQIYDLIWDTARALVYFGSHSVNARERMEAHFKKCFGLTLIPLLSYIRGGEILEGTPEERLLEELKPCVMAP
jgi:hypothetical protein